MYKVYLKNLVCIFRFHTCWDLDLHVQIFLNRLCTCVFDKDTVRYGFVPAILDIVQKYDLSEYITDSLFDGQFPGKLQWFSHTLHILTLESGTVEINLAIKNAVRSSEELLGYDTIVAVLSKSKICGGT
jgi:hypothetical protein